VRPVCVRLEDPLIITALRLALLTHARQVRFDHFGCVDHQ
jgi:hypothetical protein